MDLAPEKFLSGKVLKYCLPLIEGRPGPDTPSLKRLALGQGRLDQIHDSDEGMRYMAVIELRAGGLRGNHYHKVKEERIYVIAGRLRVHVEDPAAKERVVIPLAAGELIVIPAGVAHVLEPLEPGQGIEFSPTRFDPGDIFPCRLV